MCPIVRHDNVVRVGVVLEDTASQRGQRRDDVAFKPPEDLPGAMGNRGERAHVIGQRNERKGKGETTHDGGQKCGEARHGSQFLQ